MFGPEDPRGRLLQQLGFEFPQVLTKGRTEDAYGWSVSAEYASKLDGLDVTGAAFPEPPVAEDSGIDKRLDWRFIDLRHPRNALIFRIQTTLEQAWRQVWHDRGFVELHEIGVTTKVPRMVAVDPLGAYAAAHGAGAITEVPDVDSVAFSIAVPTGTQQALDAVTASGGTALAGGDDEEILRRQRELARAEGLFLEPSSVVPLTALDDLVAAGVAGPDDAVVLIGTSSGLKDVGAAAGPLPAVPVIEPDIRSLERYLALS